MIVSWLILTGTAYDDFGFLRCFDCRPAACQLERFGQNRGRQTNWHVAFDFGARVFQTLHDSIFAGASGRSLGVGALLGHRDDGAWRVQLRRRPQIDPDGHGLGLRTAGYSLVDGLGARIMGDALAYVSWLLIFAPLFYTPIILDLRGRPVLPRNAKQISVGILAGFDHLSPMSSSFGP